MLQQDFNKSYLKPGTKQRILYVLGRTGIQLPFEKSVKLTHQGLKLPGTSKTRAINLIYLLLPKKESQKRKWIEEFEPFLWDKLGFDLKGIEYNKNPKWNDEWAQKRMVTALGRIGSLKAKEHLEHFAQEVETRPKPTTRLLKRKRTNLKKSIQRAIYDLQNRHSLTTISS